MSKTLDQIYIANPSTTMLDTDLLYLVHSPYTSGTDSAITYANFATAVGGFAWVNASSTPITAAINTGYYITDASTVTITLPVTAPAGSIVSIVGFGAGGWILRPGGGQSIQILDATATTSIASAESYDCISVLCVISGTTWVSFSSTTTAFNIT